ncbi:ROK family transcriptional regulator [Nonomuraea sp. NPDC049607]|uniref:ROK family transcriptional regulator n=1 Tax=Nonomuraea sp. NPDC049607 TaxID=3154732 RepID=UPI003428139A
MRGRLEHIKAQPGRPRLLRELNDRAALKLLGSSGAMTRAQVSEMTGLSKVTASNVLSRLEDRGFLIKVGVQEGGRGPSAALYGLNPSCGYVVGIVVYLDATTAVLADISGDVLAETAVATDPTVDPTRTIQSIVTYLTKAARIDVAQVQVCVISLPAVIDPTTSHIRFCYDMPAWRGDVNELLRQKLRMPITIDNDVNLAAIAERALGTASDVRSFILVWIGRGPGSAAMVGDQLLRGTVGAAGELGWMPVPGAPLSDGEFDRNRHEVGAAFQSLVGWRAVQKLAAEHGIVAESAAGAVAVAAGTAAATAAGAAFLDELAQRIALGVTSICTVLDPELVVLGSDVGTAGGDELAGRVQTAVAGMCLARPRVEASRIPHNPVVRGALLVAVEQAREQVFFGG